MRVALITVSFAADFERCRMLVESVARCVAPAMAHLILVPRRDLACFKPLERVDGQGAGRKTSVLCIEDFWPWRIVDVGSARTRFWLSARTLPVRGWIFQQLVKMNAPAYCDADAYVFADSEVVFVRPFTPAHIVDAQDRVRLYHCPEFGYTGRHLMWHQTAARMLGMPLTYYGADYIGNLVSWRRDVLVDLLARIERVTHSDWRRVLSNTVDFSEYTAYGIFAGAVADPEQRLHWRDSRHLCHTLWSLSGDAQLDLARHMATLEPHHVAIQVQSHLGVTPDRYQDLVKVLDA